MNVVQSGVRLGMVFLPWFATENELRIGPVAFLPFGTSRYSAGGQEEWRRQYAVQTRTFVTMELADQSGLPVPVGDMTVALVPGRPQLDRWSDEELHEVFRAVQILCFAHLAQNKYFSFDAPVNSSFFQPYFVGRDAVVFGLRRRCGYQLSSWSPDGVAITVPLQCTAQPQSSFDQPLADAIWSAISDHSPSEPLKGLWEGLVAYNHANREEHWWLPEDEVLQFWHAFSRLTRCGTSARIIAKVTEALGRHTSSCAADIRRVWPEAPPRPFKDTYIEAVKSGKISRVRVAGTASLTELWLQEFCGLRNEVAHVGGLFHSYRWAWHPLEHLVMASFVFPLVVKCLMADTGTYSLTRADKFRLTMIELLLSLDNWHERAGDSTQETCWDRTFREMGTFCIGRPECAELLRKDSGEL